MSADPGAGRAVPYGAALYGLTGLVLGLGVGLLLLLLKKSFSKPSPEGAFWVTFSSLFWAMAFYVARTRLLRDFLEEGARSFPVGSGLLTLGVAVLAGVFGYLTVKFLAKSFRQRSLVPPLGAIGLFIAVVGLGYLLTGRAEAPSAFVPSEAAQRPNIILILVDTLRADHLSIYGNPRETSPEIDQLAREGTLFRHAFAPASWTKPSIATILTGLYPSTHQAIHKVDKLPDEVLTFPEVLRANGYTTVGFANNVNISPTFNFQQGFSSYRYLKPDLPWLAPEAGAHLVLYRVFLTARGRFSGAPRRPREFYWPAGDVNTETMGWLRENRARPFFLLAHYMDPHDPYFTHPFDGTSYARIEDPSPDPALAETYRETYEGEIRYMDGEVGKFLAFLKQEGLYENSLVLLTADHGEEFYEHRGWWHGTSLFEEQIRVPLIVKFPKGEGRGVVSDGLAGLIDIAPTVLETAGLSPGPKIQGRSLLAGLRENIQAAPFMFAEQNLEGHKLFALRTDRLKWIEANPENPRGLPPESLYDLKEDPRETRDLASNGHSSAQKLAERLQEVHQAALRAALPSEAVTLDPATQERLRSLGYLE